MISVHKTSGNIRRTKITDFTTCSECQPQKISCLSSTTPVSITHNPSITHSSLLDCFCIDNPLQGSIQNLMEQVWWWWWWWWWWCWISILLIIARWVSTSDMRPLVSVSALVLMVTTVSTSTWGNSATLKIWRLEWLVVSEIIAILIIQVHNNIVKFVLKSFKSVTIHLEGEVYKVKSKCWFLIWILTKSLAEHNSGDSWCVRPAQSEDQSWFPAVSWDPGLLSHSSSTQDTDTDHQQCAQCQHSQPPGQELWHPVQDHHPHLGWHWAGLCGEDQVWSDWESCDCSQVFSVSITVWLSALWSGAGVGMLMLIVMMWWDSLRTMTTACTSW